MVSPFNRVDDSCAVSSGAGVESEVDWSCCRSELSTPTCSISLENPSRSMVMVLRSTT